MGQDLSVSELAADLERQIKHFRRLQTEHAEQLQHHLERAEHHREQGKWAAAELETVEERYRQFRAAAEGAGELAGRYAPPPPEPAPEPEPAPRPAFSEAEVEACRGPSGNLLVSRLVDLLVRKRPAGEAFGISALAAEIDARFGAKLRAPVSPRAVAQRLRRLSEEGRLATVREGRPHHEALYRRPPTAGEAE